MPTGIPTKYKLCIICKKSFLPKCPSQRICTDNHYSNCPVCNKPMVWNTTRNPEPCSKECKKLKLKQFYIQKYGVDHPMQSDIVQGKFKDTMMARYGVEHALQNDDIKKKAVDTNRKQFGCDWGLQSQDIRKKISDTMMSRYGVDCGFHIQGFAKKSEKSCISRYGTKWAAQSDEVKNKIKQTMLSRYGVDNALKIPEVKDKVQQRRSEHMDKIIENMRKTFIANYGVSNCFQSEDIKNKIAMTCINKYGVAHAMQNDMIKNKVRKTIEDRYGVPWFVMSEEYKNDSNIISKINRKFGNALKNEGIPYKFERRIDSFSYDIELIDMSTVIEINPTYTHNIIGCHWKSGLEPMYHKNKMHIANNAGFKCINIFDWDDWEKIIPMLNPNKQQIDANNLNIYMLKESVANEFLKKTSIQGTFNKPSYHIGLVKDDTIYQMITINTPRYNKEYTAEIIRWQSNPRYEVIGGYGKLINFITSDKFYDIHNIVMYFDNAKQFDMDILKYMEYVGDNPPVMLWSKGNKYITSRLFNQFGYNGIHTETEMIDNGWLPIYNCGYKVYKII